MFVCLFVFLSEELTVPSLPGPEATPAASIAESRAFSEFANVSFILETSKFKYYIKLIIYIYMTTCKFVTFYYKVTKVSFRNMRNNSAKLDL